MPGSHSVLFLCLLQGAVSHNQDVSMSTRHRSLNSAENKYAVGSADGHHVGLYPQTLPQIS